MVRMSFYLVVNIWLKQSLFSNKVKTAAKSSAMSPELAAAQLQWQFLTALSQIDGNALNDIDRLADEVLKIPFGKPSTWNQFVLF